jgi:hypothetical protein
MLFTYVMRKLRRFPPGSSDRCRPQPLRNDGMSDLRCPSMGVRYWPQWAGWSFCPLTGNLMDPEDA